MDSIQGRLFKLYAVLGPCAYWVPAPFGRYASQAGWSSFFSVNGKLAWTVQEIVAPITFLHHLTGHGTFRLWQLVISGFFVAHYVNRSIIWPWVMMPSISDSNIGVVLCAMAWQYLNGFLQANAIRSMIDPDIPRGLIGILIFFFGMMGNIWHDKVLADLRRGSSSDQKYSIPHGGLYRWISFPNYVCEWIEWTGYAICLNQPAGYWFVALEILVMAPRALTGHTWYKSHFKSKFPEQRKAFVPYVW